MIPFLRMVMTILFMVIVLPPAALILFPFTFISGNVNPLYRVGMRIVRMIVWFSGTQVEVRGMENVDPAGTYIFMSNHVSNLDGAILAPRIPRRTSILAKKEIWRVPIVGRTFTLASMVPVERDNREAAVQSVKKASEVMRQGINMMVYPEGTRSPDGHLLPFKKGPFHLAAETGFPIVPVTMLGTFEMMPKGKFANKGGTAVMVWHSPIDPKQYASREELADAVAKAIRSALPPERQ